MANAPTYVLPHPTELHLNYSDWRETQTDALEWLEEKDWLVPSGVDLKTGEKFKSHSIKVLDATTGSGKTGIVLALAALNPDLRFLIMCATKLEQDQYTDNMMPDFEEKYKAMSIRGRSNYHCPYVNKVTDHEPCEASGCLETHVSDAPCTAGMECEIRQEHG